MRKEEDKDEKKKDMPDSAAPHLNDNYVFYVLVIFFARVFMCGFE